MAKFKILLVDVSLNCMSFGWIDSFEFTLFSNYWNLKIQGPSVFYLLLLPSPALDTRTMLVYFLSICQMNEHYCKSGYAFYKSRKCYNYLDNIIEMQDTWIQLFS